MIQRSCIVPILVLVTVVVQLAGSYFQVQDAWTFRTDGTLWEQSWGLHFFADSPGWGWAWSCICLYLFGLDVELKMGRRYFLQYAISVMGLTLMLAWWVKGSPPGGIRGLAFALGILHGWHFFHRRVYGVSSAFWAVALSCVPIVGRAEMGMIWDLVPGALGVMLLSAGPLIIAIRKPSRPMPLQVPRRGPVDRLEKVHAHREGLRLSVTQTGVCDAHASLESRVDELLDKIHRNGSQDCLTEEELHFLNNASKRFKK